MSALVARLFSLVVFSLGLVGIVVIVAIILFVARTGSWLFIVVIPIVCVLTVATLLIGYMEWPRDD